jgi:hypothetical protein
LDVKRDFNCWILALCWAFLAVIWVRCGPKDGDNRL